MKLLVVQMAHLVAPIFSPQAVSDFEHEIGADGSSCCLDSVSTATE